MITTDCKDVKDRLDRVRMHAFTPGQHFCHTERAFGYRMTDMQAAIGIEQLKKADGFMRRRREIRAMYEEKLNNPHMKFAKRSVELEKSGVWVMPILANSEEQRDKIRQHIADHGIDSRTYFQPMDEQAFLTDWSSRDYPIASKLARCGFYVPLYPSLSDEDVNYIIDKLNIYND